MVLQGKKEDIKLLLSVFQDNTFLIFIYFVVVVVVVLIVYSLNFNITLNLNVSFVFFLRLPCEYLKRYGQRSRFRLPNNAYDHKSFAISNCMLKLPH